MAFTPLQQNWKVFADDGAEPTASLAAENTTPILANATNIIRLRVTVDNTGTTGGTNKAITLEYSTDDTNFTAFGAGNAWNYANGQATDAATTTTFKTTDGTTHFKYHENGTGTETWSAGTVGEMDIAIAPTATVARTKYFFRVLQAATACALNTGKTHPSVLVPAQPAPGSGTLTATGQAPSLILPTLLAMTVGALTLSGIAPAKSYQGPDTGTLTIAGQAPTLASGGGGGGGTTLLPAIGTLTLTGQGPVVLLSAAVPSGALAITGPAPTLTGTATLLPPAGALAFTGQAPTSGGAQVVTPTVGTLTLTGQAPTLVIGSSGTRQPGAGSLTFTGAAPAQSFGGPATGTLTFTGQAPSLTGTRTVTPTVGTLTLSGQVPVRVIGGAGAVVLTPTAGALTFTGQAPAHRFGGPATGTLTFTGQAPTLSSGAGGLAPASASLTLTGQDTEVDFIGPDVGTLTFTGQAPSPVHRTPATPAAGTLAFVGVAPQLVARGAFTPPTGTLTLVGQAPALGFFTLLPSTGALVLAGPAPTLAQRGPILPPSGSLTLTGQTPATLFARSAFPLTGTLTATGQVPSALATRSFIAAPSAGTLTVAGSVPALAYMGLAQPSTGTLTLTAQTAIRIVQGSFVATPQELGVHLVGLAPTVTAAAPPVVLQPALVVELELAGIGAGWTDITADVQRQDAVLIQSGIQGGGPSDRVAATGTCRFSLNNSTHNSGGREGYYSLYHANRRTGWGLGIRCRVRLQDRNTGLWYTRFIGRLDAIDPLPGVHLERRVRVLAVDWLDEAAMWILTPAIGEQLNQTGDQILHSILAAMSTQPEATNFEVGAEAYPYALDTSVNLRQTALAEFGKLAASEVGFVYLTAAGTLRYESRHTRLTTTTPTWSLTDADLVGLELPSSRADVLNTVRVTTHPRLVDAAPTTMVYSQANAIALNPNAVTQLLGPFRDPVTGDPIGATDVQALIAGSDFVANANRDGSGDDVTTSIAVMVELGASGARFAISNTANHVVYLTTLQLRGRGVYDRGTVQYEAKDVASIATVGEHAVTVDLPYQSRDGVGQGAADYLLGKYANTLAQPKSVSVIGTSATRLAQILARDVGDLIGVQETLTGVNAPFFINGIELHVSPEQYLGATYLLAPAQDINGGRYWILGMSVLGTDTVPAPF